MTICSHSADVQLNCAVSVCNIALIVVMLVLALVLKAKIFVLGLDRAIQVLGFGLGLECLVINWMNY